MENTRYKCIYNLRLAGYLMMNGIPIKRVERNLGKPWMDVYLFEDTPAIEKFVNIYKTEKSKGKNYDTNTDSKDKAMGSKHNKV